MWVNGMIDIERQNSTAVNGVMNFASIQTFRIDPSEVYTSDRNTSISVVNIPEVELQVATGGQTEDILNSLRTQYNPLCNSQEFGIDIYLFARQHVHSLLSQ